MTAKLGFASEVEIRDQTLSEQRALEMSSQISVGELARDYSDFVGKSLSTLGIVGDLVIDLKCLSTDTRACGRPSDLDIRSAISSFVLKPFPAEASYKDNQGGRRVTGKLKDGRHVSIVFYGGSPVKASIGINRDTIVTFKLKKPTPLDVYGTVRPMVFAGNDI